MAKVTSKLQVTVPKAIANQYGIRPGDNIEWIPAGQMIRVVPPGTQSVLPDRETRLKLFDRATERQRGRSRSWRKKRDRSDRGWKREDLYQRGGTG